MNVLVTGGAGFIGSHLAEALVRDGHRVRVIDSLFSGKRSNLDVSVRFFDGTGAADFARALARTRQDEAERLAQGRQVYVYLESPCNPHGYVLDVPGICRVAHAAGLLVSCDATACDVTCAGQDACAAGVCCSGADCGADCTSSGGGNCACP